MTGHHEVKEFVFGRGKLGFGLTLPEGWKPFAAFDNGNGHTRIIARKWVRS